MSKKYTLTECYELLHADPKTFRRWLKKAGIHEQVKNQISKADDRVKYLTQEQLETIAALHERQLPITDTEISQQEDGTEGIPSPEELILVDDIVATQQEPSEILVLLPEDPLVLTGDTLPYQGKKQEQHTAKGSSKKIAIKPGTYKLIVDQLDELQQLQKESSHLALATQKALNEQEKIYQQSLELLQASSHEKITAIEQAINLQQAQYESLAATLGNQLEQFDHYKISLTANDDAQRQLIHSLEELVSQCQHSMDRSLNALRSEMAQQKEQVYAALLQTRQEIEMQMVQQHNEQKIEIHTLGEQVNGNIITLMERLSVTTEQIHKDLQEEIEARKQLAKQVATLSTARQSTTRQTAAAKSTNQPVEAKTAVEEP